MTDNQPPPGNQPPPPVSNVPPGWNPAPDRPGFLRYWDGQMWTNDYTPQPGPSTQPGKSWWGARTAMLVACAGIVVGSVLPWATGPFGLSVSGMDGDGVLFSIGAIVLAIISWSAAATKWAGIIGLVGFGAIGVGAFYDFQNISDLADGEPLVSTGAGLPVIIGSSILGLVYSVISFNDAKNARGNNVAPTPQ